MTASGVLSHVLTVVNITIYLSSIDTLLVASIWPKGCENNIIETPITKEPIINNGRDHLIIE